MGRTACTEPQCLYSIAITLLPLWAVQTVHSLSACTVQLYLFSPYGPYGLYRASVPVQYSYTFTPPMDRTACTESQCLYKGALNVISAESTDIMSLYSIDHYVFQIDTDSTFFEVQTEIQISTTLRKAQFNLMKRLILSYFFTWSHYRPGVAHKVGRGIALLFHDRGTRRGWVVGSTLRPHFTPGKDTVPILQEAGCAPEPV